MGDLGSVRTLRMNAITFHVNAGAGAPPGAPRLDPEGMQQQAYYNGWLRYHGIK